MSTVKSYNLPIIKVVSDVALIEFIAYWSKQYNYKKDIYRKIIVKKQFDEKDIKAIYKWKNGKNLSAINLKSLNNKVLKKIDIINKLKNENTFTLEEFESYFGKVSFVWKILLLHIIKPNKYPLYDQHIHRAFNYIHELNSGNITNKISDKKKREFYHEVYLKFIKENKIKELEKFDEAFFAFGKFINTGKYPDLLSKKTN